MRIIVEIASVSLLKSYMNVMPASSRRAAEAAGWNGRDGVKRLLTIVLALSVLFASGVSYADCCCSPALQATTDQATTDQATSDQATSDQATSDKPTAKSCCVPHSCCATHSTEAKGRCCSKSEADGPCDCCISRTKDPADGIAGSGARIDLKLASLPLCLPDDVFVPLILPRAVAVVDVALPKSHNRHQATLCVWRN